MELSENTIQVLRNFAGVNPNIVISSGNVLQTISEAKNILSRAEIAEQFPQMFGIYDLNEFLAVLGVVDKPQLTFSEKYVTVGDTAGRVKVKYYFSDPEMLTTPAKEIRMPDPDVSFTLDEPTFDRIKKAASALGHKELCVSGTKESVTLTVKSTDNATANTFSIDVDGKSNVDNYNFVFNISNLKVLPGTYTVNISSKLISEFVNNNNNLKYWIALEKNSTYGA